MVFKGQDEDFEEGYSYVLKFNVKTLVATLYYDEPTGHRDFMGTVTCYRAEPWN